MQAVCGIMQTRTKRWSSDSCQGLFQISVKLPHEPYKIQVMVRIFHVASRIAGMLL